MGICSNRGISVAILPVMAENLSLIKTGPGVASSIPTWSHTLVEIDHEIISTAILFHPADSRTVTKVCARSTG